jgi:hypothetical protein
MYRVIFIILISMSFLSHSYANWKIELTLKQHGTRSEHLNREICYQGKALPLELVHVITPVGEYQASSAYPGKVGWGLALDKRKTEYQGRNDSIPLELYGRGWIKSEFEKYKSSPWLYCVEYGYWVNPDRINEFVFEMTKSRTKEKEETEKGVERLK